MAFAAVVLALALAMPCCLGQSDKGLPTYVLGNWQDSVAFWSAARNCPNAQDLLYPGLQAYHRASSATDAAAATDRSASGFSLPSATVADTFALSIDDQVLGDPRLFTHSVTDGGAVLHYNGTFSVAYDMYGSQKLPFELVVDTYVPPFHDFLVTSFSLRLLAERPSLPSRVSVAALIQSSPAPCSASVVYDPASLSFAQTLDGSSCGKSADQLLVSALFDASATVAGTEIQAAPFDQVLPFFVASHGHLSNATNATGASSNGQVESAFLLHVPVAALGGSEEELPIRLFSVVRSIQPSKSAAASFLRRFRSTFKSIQDVTRLTSQLYEQFLSSSPLTAAAVSRIPPENGQMYLQSLLALKHGQNPLNGAIIASFHPLYGYKVWSRDGVFSSIIFTAAGYFQEAKMFLQWASGAQLRSDNAFHTCYNFLDGSVNGFVEPQYDGTALFLSAVLYYVEVSGDRSILSDATVAARISTFATFFLEGQGFAGLAPADYSIWEESSDQHTGAPLPTQYYTFTQAMAWAGLRSAARLLPSAAPLLEARASSLQQAIVKNLFNATGGYFMRGLWSNTHEPDGRLDSSTAALVFMGVLESAAVMAQNHMTAVDVHLSRVFRGVARYDGDLFFAEGGKWDPCGPEVSAPSPAWGVTTMFAAFAELRLNLTALVDQRLGFMLKTAARGFSPVGEAVDGVTGQFVRASAPDIYEHGGVFVLATLLRQGLAVPLWVITSTR